MEICCSNGSDSVCLVIGLGLGAWRVDWIGSFWGFS